MSFNSKTSNINTKTQQIMIDAIVKILVRLDGELSQKSTTAAQDNNITVTQLKEMYQDFIDRFVKIGELESSVLVHSVAMAKKVVKLAKSDYSFKKGEFVLIYSACLYLSVKMLIDEERWFVADFSYVSNLEEAHIEKMEQFVLIDILNFNAKISEEDFMQERLNLMTPAVPKKKLTVV